MDWREPPLRRVGSGYSGVSTGLCDILSRPGPTLGDTLLEPASWWSPWSESSRWRGCCRGSPRTSRARISRRTETGPSWWEHLLCSVNSRESSRKPRISNWKDEKDEIWKWKQWEVRLRWDILPFNIIKLHISDGVEGSLLKVNIMEVSVHVQTGGTEVVSPGDVWDETFSPTPDLRQPHPHVPVPGLADRSQWGLH